MLLLIDNYDSFTYNLYQYLAELGAEVQVRRNDAVTLADIEAMRPDSIEIEARAKEAHSAAEERRALWLDVGEGLLELGLVLSSLYFLSKRRFFALLGAIAALIGTAIGVAGFMI